MVAERNRSVSAMENSFEGHNTNQFETKAVSSEKNIAVSKVQKLQVGINSISEDLNSTRIKKE